jgi:hypothetical protein
VQQTTPKPKPVQHAHLTQQQRQLLQKNTNFGNAENFKIYFSLKKL